MNFWSIVRSAYRQSCREEKTGESLRSDMTLKGIVALVMSGASLILTILNIVKGYWFMTGTTTVLVIGFGVAALFSFYSRRRALVITIICVLAGFIFSVYAVTGQNEGFAILWILLVPMIGMSLVGLRSGTILSAYFQIFLIILFYTPARHLVEGHYTDTFMMRFPILYLTGFAVAVILASQKEYYLQKTEFMAYQDGLTSLANRFAYDSRKKTLEESGRTAGLIIFSVDINRLKFVNDNIGHHAGNELIAGSADCISRAFEGAEMISRVGGDEFAVLAYCTGTEAKARMQRLEEYGRCWNGQYIHGISLSIGMAVADEHPELSLDELEKLADSSMYRAKGDFYVQSGLKRRNG